MHASYNNLDETYFVLQIKFIERNINSLFFSPEYKLIIGLPILNL